MNNVTKRADYKCNHFLRLPEDIIVSIFDRIADLYCLCHCSLVSKHFAAAVSRVQTVYVTVTGSAAYDQEYSERISKFSLELPDCKAEQLHALLDSLSLQNMKLPVFLNKLTELKCIYLDYVYSGKSAEAKFPMCKIKFCRNGTKFESFVALESLYMHNDKDTENEAVDIEHVIAVTKRVADSWWQFRVRYMEWICFMAVLMKCHAALWRVTIADSEVQGKLVVGDEQGINLHKDVLADLWKQLSGCIVKFGWVPVLRLPLSGYVMRWATLAIVYLPENSFARAKKLDEIEFWDFDDELPVFCEGVKEFLKKHQDELRILEL